MENVSANIYFLSHLTSSYRANLGPSPSPTQLVRRKPRAAFRTLPASEAPINRQVFSLEVTINLRTSTCPMVGLR
jgi:hypothetical protein